MPKTDFRGELNGAKVYATFETHGALAAGTCFYDDGGANVPLRGAVDDHGVVMLQEIGDKGPLSTITLEREPSGAYFGTWMSEDESRQGDARLDPLVRRAGEPVFVATRHVVEPNLSRCESQAAWCKVDARVPVVLGLADHAFEDALDDKLRALANVAPPNGHGVTIDYAIALNERGFVSLEISARFLGAPGRATGFVTGLTAAVDAGEMASDATAFVDEAKARAALVSLERRAHESCDAPFDDGQGRGLVHDAVLTDTGVAFAVDRCRGAVRAPGWAELGFSELGEAMRRGTPFDAAWSRGAPTR